MRSKRILLHDEEKLKAINPETVKIFERYKIDMTMAVYSTVCAIAVMTRRGRTKEYIQKFFDDMCLIYDYPAQFGKELTMNDLMKQFEQDYGINFKRINVHLETEKQFIRGVTKC